MELAMDRPGEIGWQCRALEPDLGAILNIGHVHAENVGGIEKVYETKKDLADYLQRTGKPLVLNVDDEWLEKIPPNFTSKLLTYGRKGNDFKLLSTEISIEGTSIKFEHDGKKYETSIKAHGTDLAYNMLAAIALAGLLGVDVKDSVKSIQSYGGYIGRFYLHKINDELTVVNDAYNANPASMRMAINTFDQIFDTSYEKIVILGDMKELGDVTKREHKKLGELVESKNFDKVYYLGDYYEDFGIGEKLLNVEQAELILARLKKSKRKNVAVLLKASHSIGLFDIVNFVI
jgi:UDP-N-acetylmuramoyl-tripeptide--D-alanyl-D-alanine ligase